MTAVRGGRAAQRGKEGLPSCSDTLSQQLQSLQHGLPVTTSWSDAYRDRGAAVVMYVHAHVRAGVLDGLLHGF